jgi:hypothetical protein
MENEVIVPFKYVLTQEEEIGIFPGVAYKTADNKIRNEILWGNNKFMSVTIIEQLDENMVFTISHVFVERYIKKCLDRTIDNVEIFRLYVSRGEYPERPSDMQGELIRHYADSRKNDVWTSYEHISGPYLADPQYLVSAFTSGNLDDISPVITENLIIDKAAYRRNPADLPILGVVVDSDEATRDQKYLEDMVLRTKTKKTIFLN